MSNIVRRDRFSTAADLSTRASEPHVGYRDSSEMLDIRLVAQKLWRRKALILLVFLLVLIPTAVGTYLTTPLYRSSVLIQVNPDPVQVAPFRDVADSSGAGSSYEDYIGNQEQLLRGRTLISRVAARLGAPDLASTSAGEEASRLGGEFDVLKIERSQLFELSYRAPDPEAAATVANLFAEEYVKQTFAMRQATREQAEVELKRELDALEIRLQDSEEELIAYARRNGMVNLEANQVDPSQQNLSVLTQQVADAGAELARASAAHDTAMAVSAVDFPETLVTQQITNLESRAFELERELTTLRARYGELWPDVTSRRNELELVQQQLDQQKAAVLRRRREQTRLDLEAAQARQTILSQSLAEQTGLVNRIHEASVEYNILRREVDTNRNLHEGLLERLRQTGVIAGFQFGNVQIVEPAVPTMRPDSPRIMQNLTFAALMGLALGCCVVFVTEFWDSSISTIEEVEQLGPIPTLGRLPLIKGTKSSPALLAWKEGLATPGNGSSALAKNRWFQTDSALPVQIDESIRSICASILLSRSNERPRTIVITSAVPAEGKTTVAAHLARAFANAGTRTLLVETDFRKPDLSQSMAIGGEDGLSLYLAGHVSPLPKIHSTEVEHLSLAAAGPRPPNPAALLQSDRMRSFLNTAAAEYHTVILDAPPLLTFADARVLGAEADGVVLVVRADRTPRHLVRRAWGMLESSGSNVLGMVLNGAQPDPSEWGGYNSYYKYHQQYESNSTLDSKSA